MDAVALPGALPGLLGVGALSACAAWIAVPTPRTRTGDRDHLARAPVPGTPNTSLRTRLHSPRLHDPRLRRHAAAATAGLCTAVFLGGMRGLVAAPVVAVLVHRRLARRVPAADRRRGRRIADDLPTAADLMAACLVAGASPTDAASAVAAAMGGPIGDELRSAAAAVRLGGDPARCWAALADQRELAPLGRALSHGGGAPLAERIGHVADECRDRRRGELTAAARRTAVRATLPLGVCFLPAFLLIGVIPIVVGLATPLLGRT